MLNDYLDWPHLKQVFKQELKATLNKHANIGEEVVSGLTSLTADQASPTHLLETVRSYWGIENGLHYRRDKSLHEDATQMSNPTQAEAMAI